MTPRRSVILDVCVQAEFHTLLVVSVYLLASGHNQAGGGFAGGLVASCAFCLRYAGGGDRAVRRSISVPPTTIIGVGLLFALVTGFVSVVLGGDFLESSKLTVDLPVIGEAYTSSVIFFDTGVYLTVLGMALLMLEQFGSADSADPDGEGAPQERAAEAAEVDAAVDAAPTTGVAASGPDGVTR